MKKVCVLFILIVLGMTACSKKAESVKLEPDTPAYVLGKELASTYPPMDPDSNMVFIKSDNFEITAGELLLFLKEYYGDRTEELKTMPIDRIKSIIAATTNQIAEKKLLMKEAKRGRFKATTTEIDSFLNMQYTRAGGEDKFLENLKNYNISIESVKDDVKGRIIIQAYLESVVTKKGEITEKKLKEAHENMMKDTLATVRHILFLTQKKSDAEKNQIKKRMDAILARAKKGEDFAELAKEFTEDRGSKENGGLYENFPRGQMVKSFEDAAFSIPIGELSGIIETQYGFHILKVLDRKANDIPYKEARPELLKKLRDPLWQTIVPKHIEELKTKVNFEVIAL